MPRFLLFVILTFATTLWAMDVGRYSVRLREFSFPPPNLKEISRRIECSESEVSKSRERLKGSEGHKHSDRDLEPAHDPWIGQAAWSLDQHCASLMRFDGALEFNQVGFDQFNRETGEAVIYVSSRELDARALPAHPAWMERNVFKYEAQCAIVERNWFVRIYRASELICTLKGDQGFLRLEISEK